VRLEAPGPELQIEHRLRQRGVLGRGGRHLTLDRLGVRPDRDLLVDQGAALLLLRGRAHARLGAQQFRQPLADLLLDQPYGFVVHHNLRHSWRAHHAGRLRLAGGRHSGTWPCHCCGIARRSDRVDRISAHRPPPDRRPRAGPGASAGGDHLPHPGGGRTGRPHQLARLEPAGLLGAVGQHRGVLRLPGQHRHDLGLQVALDLVPGEGTGLDEDQADLGGAAQLLAQRVQPHLGALQAAQRIARHHQHHVRPLGQHADGPDAPRRPRSTSTSWWYCSIPANRPASWSHTGPMEEACAGSYMPAAPGGLCYRRR